MSNWYVSYSSGADTNTGSSWALAWKTLSSGATAARVAAGDYVLVQKSPDPTLVGTCTWVNSSNSVTLPNAATRLSLKS